MSAGPASSGLRSLYEELGLPYLPDTPREEDALLCRYFLWLLGALKGYIGGARGRLGGKTIDLGREAGRVGELYGQWLRTGTKPDLALWNEAGRRIMEEHGRSMTTPDIAHWGLDSAHSVLTYIAGIPRNWGSLKEVVAEADRAAERSRREDPMHFPASRIEQRMALQKLQPSLESVPVDF